MKDNYEYFKYEFLDKTYYIMVNQSVGIMDRVIKNTINNYLNHDIDLNWIEEDLLHSCAVCLDSSGRVLKCRENISKCFDLYYGIEK